ncbi:acriflavine sensitivity control protein acr-2 [Metarhizium album ARSEF 1941]|uniref:Acriflavine sensitivity control protein acr-2 n=1 Tax=Metarhizium album (strain ARSEF 1941) TaxID=1081103 RepID=A0A0B2WJZ4_METAS|nr:acriflavine sensitivity control protein acr-2 [Metarhizium album ARSEF 1941]KHN93772.1 acriflavine sensitivity control protein acr-2 [Metarhizium album ARSEF 1941]
MQAIDSQGNPRPSPPSGRRPSKTGACQPQAAPKLGGRRRDVAVSWAAAGAGGRDLGQIHNVQVTYSERGRDEPLYSGQYQQPPLAPRDAVSGGDRDGMGETAATDRDGSIANVPTPDHRVHVPTKTGCFGGRSLTDPVFQDLDPSSRSYLAHFTNRVCQDLVPRDSPNSNPFRELIPLTNKHPLLLYVLIATSAIHWSNISWTIPSIPIPTGLTNPGDYVAQLRSQDSGTRRALIDALTAKQKAIKHLRRAISSLDPAGNEVTLAAMHFFVKFELIDFERRVAIGNNPQEEREQGVTDWRAHLQAASRILGLLASDSSGHASSRMLRDCVIADCFIYHTLGSTLADTAGASRITQYAFELLHIMKRVEVNSYLSCPPEILRIILFASQLSREDPCADCNPKAIDTALALINEALAFDIAAWADQLRGLPNVTDIDSRIHVASAHRSAVCLHILQALPPVRAVHGVDANFLVSDILSHLSQIHDGDPYFKATSWPTFIAGAETRDGETRTWILTRMLAIWHICPWGYIFAAIRMLNVIWDMQSHGPGSAVNWLQKLKEGNLGYLIV